MKVLKIFTSILMFMVLAVLSGFIGFWLAQGNHNETSQVTQVTQETQETRKTQEIDPWVNWEEPRTVKFEGEDILINNGQGVASQIKWMIMDDNPTLVQVTDQETNMLQWSVQFEDGEFGYLVLNRVTNDWSLTKGVN